jgi:hypothetical protein
LRAWARTAAVLAGIASALGPAACGGGTTPTRPSPTIPSGPAAAKLTGDTTDGMTNAPLSGVTISIDGIGEVVSDANGRFEVAAANPQVSRVAVITSPQVITRETRLLTPGPHAALCLMPASMDLVSFDQMFRASRGELHRWTTAPNLVVYDRVLQFTNTDDQQYAATDASLLDEDVQALVDDLAWGVREATGGALSSFADISRLTAAPGEQISVRRTGAVVVARYAGLQDATGYWGYGRWATNGSGAVVAGIVMIEAGFDASTSPYKRSLRVHELGHALGYGHVNARVSFMNSSAVTLPTSFDMAAASLAFRRPPLNRSPDVDPTGSTVNQQTGEVTWLGLP